MSNDKGGSDAAIGDPNEGNSGKSKKKRLRELEVTVYGLQRDNAELVKMNRSLLVRCKELLNQ